MQPTYVKLKLPIKAIQVLIFIMLSLQHCAVSYSLPRCTGPVSKTKVYNQNLYGYVYINQTNKKIMINRNNDSFLYKISTTYQPPGSTHRELSNDTQQDSKLQPAFYLFDPNTKRFLCWKNEAGPVVGLTYDRIEKGATSWDLCKFSDSPPKDERYNSTHVNLHLVFLRDSMLSFDRKGLTIPQRRVQKCLHKNEKGRHSRNARKKNKCYGNNLFLLYYNINKVDDCFGTAYETLCRDKTARMDELAAFCKSGAKKMPKKRLQKIAY